MPKSFNLERRVFSKKNGSWTTDIHMQKNEVETLPYTRINSKLIKNLNLRAKMINLLEKNLGVILHDLGFDSDFLGMTPKA